MATLPGSAGFQPTTTNPAGKMPALPGGKATSGRQRPMKRGSRFSRNAATPSARSCERPAIA